MNSVYEKLSVIISQLLLYSPQVYGVSKPVFTDDSIIISIKDKNGMSMNITIPYTKLMKVHDHLLYAYIFELMREYKLV